MKSTITIQDQTFTGDVQSTVTISTSKTTITVRELIQARVEQEVANYNSKLPEYFKGLVQPTDAERVLNGYKLRNRRQIDAEKQTYLALDAFQKNGFFVLVNNQQVETLEEQIQVSSNLEVAFIKLTPLVGG